MPIIWEKLDELDLPLIASNHPDKHITAFTVSVGYNQGATTGISA